MNAIESRVPVGHTSLYARSIGRGQPLIVLHGGPDFDHRYFLPDLDQFKDEFRLIYYDQRGRGGSAGNVRPEDVSLESDLDDLVSLQQHFRTETTLLLGHSWGALLTLEYTLRHPAHVSHLILMNPAPVSGDDTVNRARHSRRAAGYNQRLRAFCLSRSADEVRHACNDFIRRPSEQGEGEREWTT